MGKSSRPLVLLPQFCSVAKFYKEVNGEVARASQVSAVSLLAGGCIRDLSGSPVKSLPYLSWNWPRWLLPPPVHLEDAAR